MAPKLISTLVWDIGKRDYAGGIGHCELAGSVVLPAGPSALAGNLPRAAFCVAVKATSGSWARSPSNTASMVFNNWPKCLNDAGERFGQRPVCVMAATGHYLSSMNRRMRDRTSGGERGATPPPTRLSRLIRGNQ